MAAMVLLRWADWYTGLPCLDSVGKTEDGHVVVASDTTFLGACPFQCLVIFVINILRSCKGVVLANRQLDKFFCFCWIVVYIRIGVVTVP